MHQFSHNVSHVSNVSRIKRLTTHIALGGIIISATIAASSLIPSAVPARASGLYFAATGHSVGGAFLRFYKANGGLRVFGLPLTDELAENGRTVQYFERQRFEYHPEALGIEFDVQLSLLGENAAQGKPALSPVAPFNSKSNLAYISETGHSISGVFLDYWQRNGDVKVLGYPVSEPLNENGLIVQYFERARMEYHPEKLAKGFPVELGLLGKDFLQAHSAPGMISVQTDKAAASAPDQEHSRMEQNMLNRINGARQSAGLQPVAADPTVAGLSLHRSADMAARNYFSHQAPGGDDYLSLLRGARVPYKWSGEIIAWNDYPQDQTVAQAFDGFMHSPPHNSIIMDPRYNYAGVGVVKNGNDKYFYTVIFVQR